MFNLFLKLFILLCYNSYMEFFEFLKEKNNHTYNYDKYNSKFKIKDIFNDHWYSFIEDNPNLNT